MRTGALGDPVGRGLTDVVGEDVATPHVGEGAQRGAGTGAVEDVVAEHEGDGLVADEVGADDEGLGEALGARLDGVLEGDAEVGAVTQ